MRYINKDLVQETENNSLTKDDTCIFEEAAAEVFMDCVYSIGRSNVFTAMLIEETVTDAINSGLEHTELEE